MPIFVQTQLYPATPTGGCGTNQTKKWFRYVGRQKSFVNTNKPSGISQKAPTKDVNKPLIGQNLTISATEIGKLQKPVYTSYSKNDEVKLVTIGLASANRIRQWAEKTLPNGKVVGEVTNANTLHHKTFKPQKGGLFCERIFGPLKDFQCACVNSKKGIITPKSTFFKGFTQPSLDLFSLENKPEDANNLDTTNEKKANKTQTTTNLSVTGQQSNGLSLGLLNNYKRFFCEKCDVEYTWSVIRRYQLGYIKLNAPVTHVWYVKGTPSYISLLLDMQKKHVQYVAYCTETLTLENSLKGDQFYTVSDSPNEIFAAWQKYMDYPNRLVDFDGSRPRRSPGIALASAEPITNQKTNNGNLQNFNLNLSSDGKKKLDSTIVLDSAYSTQNPIKKNSYYFKTLLPNSSVSKSGLQTYVPKSSASVAKNFTPQQSPVQGFNLARPNLSKPIQKRISIAGTNIQKMHKNSSNVTGHKISRIEPTYNGLTDHTANSYQKDFVGFGSLLPTGESVKNQLSSNLINKYKSFFLGFNRDRLTPIVSALETNLHQNRYQIAGSTCVSNILTLQNMPVYMRNYNLNALAHATLKHILPVFNKGFYYIANLESSVRLNFLLVLISVGLKRINCNKLSDPGGAVAITDPGDVGLNPSPRQSFRKKSNNKKGLFPLYSLFRFSRKRNPSPPAAETNQNKQKLHNMPLSKITTRLYLKYLVILMCAPVLDSVGNSDKTKKPLVTIRSVGTGQKQTSKIQKINLAHNLSATILFNGPLQMLSGGQKKAYNFKLNPYVNMVFNRASKTLKQILIKKLTASFYVKKQTFSLKPRLEQTEIRLDKSFIAHHRLTQKNLKSFFLVRLLFLYKQSFTQNQSYPSVANGQLPMQSTALAHTGQKTIIWNSYFKWLVYAFGPSTVSLLSTAFSPSSKLGLFSRQNQVRRGRINKPLIQTNIFMAGRPYKQDSLESICVDLSQKSANFLMSSNQRLLDKAIGLNQWSSCSAVTLRATVGGLVCRATRGKPFNHSKVQTGPIYKALFLNRLIVLVKKLAILKSNSYALFKELSESRRLENKKYAKPTYYLSRALRARQQHDSNATAQQATNSTRPISHVGLFLQAKTNLQKKHHTQSKNDNLTQVSTLYKSLTPTIIRTGFEYAHVLMLSQNRIKTSSNLGWFGCTMPTTLKLHKPELALNIIGTKSGTVQFNSNIQNKPVKTITRRRQAKQDRLGLFLARFEIGFGFFVNPNQKPIPPTEDTKNKSDIPPLDGQNKPRTIVNNIYCFSHRQLWDQEKDWQFFALYYFATPNFDDTVAPVYSNRTYDFSLLNTLFTKETTNQALVMGTSSPIGSLRGTNSSSSEKSRTFLDYVPGRLGLNMSHTLDSSTTALGSNILKPSPNVTNKQDLNVSFSGAGIIKTLLAEYDYFEMKKIDKQNRILLYDLNKYIRKLKKSLWSASISSMGKRQIPNKTELESLISPQNKPTTGLPFTTFNKYYSIIKKILRETCKQRDALIRRTKFVRKLLKNANNKLLLEGLHQSLDPVLTQNKNRPPTLDSGFVSRQNLLQNKQRTQAGVSIPYNNATATRQSRVQSMILTLLPVLPPDLRPIVKMGNQIAASDLNRLYQRVIYRNDRLKKFLKDPTTNGSYEMKYAQRLLQEAVDNLIQNGKSGVVPEKDARGRALKSLSDLLKGKQGRFRQYLLGKRVDYSGRSVIVVGPKLKLHECGIPKEMALELYLPFLIKRILNQNFARTVIGAKALIQKNKPLTWSLLREIMKTCPVLLNRAPTLHRLGFQAFQPKLVDGRAILLHPLVCPAFNADFDGDQMAVHIPISVEARAEAWKLMLSRNNLLSPATGEPLVLPSQDMVLGCYYLTTNSNLRTQQYEKGYGQYFDSLNDVLRAYHQGMINIHTIVWVKWNGRLENTNDLEQPLEVRINRYGNSHFIYAKSQTILNNNRFLPNSKNPGAGNTNQNKIIKTTPGKILFNVIINS